MLEDVEADLAIAVDIHMINFSRELNIWRLEGVVGWKINVEEEYALVVWGVLRAHDRRLPVELVCFVCGSGRAVRRRVFSEIN